MKTLKQRMISGEFLLGTHIQACDPSLTELVGRCGFDYLWIDTEHTAIDYRILQTHLTAASAAGCPAIVRVPWNEPYLVKRILDQGPDGIIFPSINSAEDAKKAMEACMYPPRGSRGYGPIRAAGYGLFSISEYLEHVDETLCRLIQVEHVSSVLHLEEILEVPGIDGVILGPCDLSGSIGRLGEMDHPEVSALIEQTIQVCKRKGLPVGVSLGACDGEAVSAWKHRGVQLVSANSEYGYILQGASRMVSSVKRGQ